MRDRFRREVGCQPLAKVNETFFIWPLCIVEQPQYSRSLRYGFALAEAPNQISAICLVCVEKGLSCRIHISCWIRMCPKLRSAWARDHGTQSLVLMVRSAFQSSWGMLGAWVPRLIPAVPRVRLALKAKWDALHRFELESWKTFSYPNEQHWERASWVPSLTIPC